MIYLNFLTWAIAVSAFTYSNILTEPGMILEELHKYLDEVFVGKNRWYFQVLINCQFCVAGQWAMYYYIIYILQNNLHYDFFTHVWFILQTIFITKLITWVYYRVFKF